MGVTMNRLVEDFASALSAVDGRRPQAFGQRTKREFQPGIGPLSEAKTTLRGPSSGPADPAGGPVSIPPE